MVECRASTNCVSSHRARALSPARVHNCVFRLFYTCCTAAQHRDCGDPLGGHRTEEFRESKIRWSPCGPQLNIIGFTADNTVGLVVEYSPATGETRVRFPDGVCAQSIVHVPWRLCNILLCPQPSEVVNLLFSV